MSNMLQITKMHSQQQLGPPKFCVPNFLVCSKQSSLGFLNRFVTYYLVFTSIKSETAVSHNAKGLANELDSLLEQV